MTNEVWKDIKGYEGYYQISKSGKVRSLDRVVPDGRGFEKEIDGKEIILYNNDKNVLLCKNGKSKYHNIKELLKENFNIKNKPIGYKLTKKDIDKIKKMYLSDKYTRKEIANNFGVTTGTIDYHARKFGLTNSVRRSKKLNLNEVKEIKRLLKKGGNTYREIADMYGVSESNIGMIKRGKSWSDVKINDKKAKKYKKDKETKSNEDNFLQKFIKRILNLK